MAHPYLAAIRAAHVERIEAAYARDLERRDTRWGFCGLPYSLISAGSWLVHNGYEGDACAAEKATNWGPARYRQYLAALTPDARAEEIEDGRKAIFEGRHPIYAEAHRELGRAAA